METLKIQDRDMKYISAFPFMWGSATLGFASSSCPPSPAAFASCNAQLQWHRNSNKERKVPGPKESWTALPVNQPPFFQITLANGGSTFKSFHLQKLISHLSNSKKNEAGQVGRLGNRKANYTRRIVIASCKLLLSALELIFGISPVLQHQPKDSQADRIRCRMVSAHSMQRCLK